jgi:hypothetical protein
LEHWENVVNTYRDLGGYIRRLKEVQEIQEKVLEVRRRTLAADDPGTADSMHVLALTLYHPERMPEETILLMEEAACSYALYCSDLPKLWDTATA